MALPEQRLLCRLDWDGHQVTGVHLHCGRLLETTRLFRDRRPGEVLKLLPRLYTLCGQAHTAAARLALSPETPAPTDDIHRVRLENLREHLLYLFIHWPEANGQDTAAHELVPALGLITRLISTPGDTEARRHLDTWLEQRLFAMPADDFLALDAAGLHTWAQHGTTLPARQLHETLTLTAPPPPALPALTQDDLATVAQALDSDHAAEFVARPALSDDCRRTGPAATLGTDDDTAGLPALGQLIVARLHALARGWAAPADTAQPLFRSAGLACAETSRGLLVHRVHLRGGRVSDYRILAPTEWNFHPRGLAARWLARIETRTTGELRRLASRIVRAIDPCVAFSIRIDTPDRLPEAAHA